MKKLPPFLLVRRPDLTQLEIGGSVNPKKNVKKKAAKQSAKPTKPTSILGNARLYSPAEQAVQKAAFNSGELRKTFSLLGPRFRHALADSFASASIPHQTKASKTGKKIGVSSELTIVARDLARHAKVIRVGILDLGAWIAGLPDLLERLNHAQSLFTIFEIHAPVPAGLLKSKDTLITWAKSMHGTRLSRSDTEDLQHNVVADFFFEAAEDIRKDLGLHHIVGLTAAMIAGHDRDGLYWNHFASTLERTSIVSTADLRESAAEAGKPFEAAVGALLVPTLLVAFNDKLNYHSDTGCLFDYDGDRNFVKKLKHLHFDAPCLALMTAVQREAALSMLKVLNQMGMKS